MLLHLAARLIASVVLVWIREGKYLNMTTVLLLLLNIIIICIVCTISALILRHWGESVVRCHRWGKLSYLFALISHNFFPKILLVCG